MVKADSTKLVGIITDIDSCADDLYLGLRDEEGRLLAITYDFRDKDGALERIENTLEEGMKVEIKVRGSISEDNESYEGFGIIRVLENKDR